MNTQNDDRATLRRESTTRYCPPWFASGALAFVFACITIATCSLGTAAEQDSDTNQFVRLSPRDSRYFELTNGRPYIPVGFNLVGPPPAEDLKRVVGQMADHGVNYCRIWLDQPLWSVEHAESGVYDDEKAEQLDRFLDLCRPRGIRVKMCIEWFRSIAAKRPTPPVKGSFPKPIHHVANGGFYQDMNDFLTSARGRTQFKGKLRWYADRYGDEPQGTAIRELRLY